MTLSPTEPPLRVAQALGRPVAIVRMGVRKPTIEEIQAGPGGDVGLDWAASIGSGPCPFLTQGGAKCTLPCGPVCTPAPSPKQPSAAARRIPLRRRRPRHPGGGRVTGRVGGIDPRDTVVGFDIGVKGRVEPRVLPTNVVCIYAPRFAEVRVTNGPNQNVDIQHVNTNKHLSKYSQSNGIDRLEETGAEPVARAHARAIAGHGPAGAILRRREIEQPRAERVPRRCDDDHQSSEAEPRAGPQPPEARPAQREDPARRHQDGGGPGHRRPVSKAPARPSRCGGRTR